MPTYRVWISQFAPDRAATQWQIMNKIEKYGYILKFQERTAEHGNNYCLIATDKLLDEPTIEEIKNIPFVRTSGKPVEEQD